MTDPLLAPLNFTGMNGLAPDYMGDLNSTTANPTRRYLGVDGQVADGIFDPLRIVGYLTPPNNTFADLTGTITNSFISRAYSSATDTLFLAQDGAILSKLVTLADTSIATDLTLGGQSAFRDLELYQMNGFEALFYLYKYTNSAVSTNQSHLALGFRALDTEQGAFELSADVLGDDTNTGVDNQGIGNGTVYSSSAQYNRTKLAQKFLTGDFILTGEPQISGVRLALEIPFITSQSWTLKVGIQGDSGGSPDGTYVANASTTISASDLPTYEPTAGMSLNSGYAYVYFEFPAIVTLSQATTYHLVIEPTIPAATLSNNNGIRWMRSNTGNSAYATGAAEYANTTVNLLVVGGGGGGGKPDHTTGFPAGAGGAGAYHTDSAFEITTGTAYTVTIGAGGAAQTSTGTSGNQGSNSVFGSVTALGGGRGGKTGVAGANGGSGGGGGGGQSGGTGVSGEGFAGGSGSSTGNGSGGGGGGASAVGNDGSATNGGGGGAGTANSISGASVTYAGGGGGGCHNGGTPGAGGAGGGGVGDDGTGAGGNGTANTGGGGGGGGISGGGSEGNGGAGGSGIVIISAPQGAITATGGVHTTSGGMDIWTFTTSGTWTPTIINDDADTWTQVTTASFDFAVILNRYDRLFGPTTFATPGLDSEGVPLNLLIDDNTTGVFLQKADNGIMYVFSGPDVHKFEGGSTNGGFGTLTQDVLNFPSYFTIVDAVDTNSIMYMAVQTSESTLPDNRQFGADVMGVYSWDRITTSYSMRNFVPIYGAREIRKIFVTAEGDLRVITIGEDKFTELRAVQGGKLVVIRRLGLEAYPRLRDSVDVLNNMVTWLGADGIVYSLGTTASKGTEQLYKIGSINDEVSGTLSSGILSVGNEYASQSLEGVFLGWEDNSKTLTKWYPHAVGTINGVAQTGGSGDVYSLVYEFPKFSNVAYVHLYGLQLPDDGAGNTTQIATLNLFYNKKTTADQSFPITRKDMLDGFAFFPLNKKGVFSVQLQVVWEESQTLGTYDFTPSRAVVAYDPSIHQLK